MHRRRLIIAAMVLAGVGLLGYGLWTIQLQGMVSSRQAVAVADELLAAYSPTADTSGAPGPESIVWRTDYDQYDALVATHDAETLYRTGTGEPWGVLEVPSWQGLHDPIWHNQLTNHMPIAEGDGLVSHKDPVLDKAYASHYTATQGPGAVGNFVLAGHRRTRGNTFLLVPDLKAGDTVVITTPLATLQYTVTDDDRHHYLSPSDTVAFAPVPGDWARTPPSAADVTDGTNRILTLQTCTGPNANQWENTYRWYTHATLTGWAPRA